MSKSKIIEIANGWVGRDFHPGVAEQCMAFVRQVLQEARHPLASRITKEPVDKEWTGTYLASSLAGRDLGEIVDKIGNLKPGAIIFWENTYGDYPAGTITHVGIYVGDGYFVHRPTSSRPVEKAYLSGFWSSAFRCGLNTTEEVEKNPKPLPKQPVKLKLYAKPGKMILVANQDVLIKAGVEMELSHFSFEAVEGA